MNKIVTLISSILLSVNALASSIPYGQGYMPDIISMGDGTYLEVHNSESATELWYNILKMDQDGTLNSIHIGKYGLGIAPQITSMGNGEYLEVHQEKIADPHIFHNKLFYSVLQVQPDGSLTRVFNKQYDVGLSPDITPMGHNGKFLEVHQSDANRLWYRILQLQPNGSLKTLVKKTYDNGAAPRIIPMGSNGKYLEIHESANGSSTKMSLWYDILQVQPDGSLTRIFSKEYDHGYNSSITSMGNGKYLEVHQLNWLLPEDLYYDVLQIQSDGSLKKMVSEEYGAGIFPKITTMGNGKYLEVHNSINDNSLWYKVLEVQADSSLKDTF